MCYHHCLLYDWNFTHVPWKGTCVFHLHRLVPRLTQQTLLLSTHISCRVQRLRGPEAAVLQVKFTAGPCITADGDSSSYVDQKETVLSTHNQATQLHEVGTVNEDDLESHPWYRMQTADPTAVFKPKCQNPTYTERLTQTLKVRAAGTFHEGADLYQWT